MSDDEEHIEEDEICLHASLSPSKAYVIDSGASNHIVASMESFITFPLSGGPRSKMGDDSKIPTVERGSHKIQHDDFIPSPIKKEIVEDEEEAGFSSQSIRIEEILLGVTPSPTTPEVYAIYDISYRHMVDPK